MEKKLITVMIIWIIVVTVLGGVFACLWFDSIQTQKELYANLAQNRYQLISHGENLILLDAQTGELRQLYLPQKEGPNDWRVLPSPLK